MRQRAGSTAGVSSDLRRRAHKASAVPRMPLGRKSVTTTKRPPSAKSQYGAMKPEVNSVLAQLTTTAPSAAPTSVPRPPTATQITVSIELAGANSLGLMMPTCGT